MNPFNPSFGKVPTVFLDRNKLVNTVTKNLENPNSPYQTTLIYGLRGVGKTSFLTDVSKTVAKKKNWIVVNLVPNDKILPTLIEGIYKQSTPKLKKIFDKVNGFKISAFGIEINGQKNNDASVSQIALETILEQLKKQNAHLLVTIDEISSIPEIRSFASIYQIMIREEFYISLIMTGLPDQVSELQNDKVLTFLLRSKRITLSPLNKLDVKYRYREAFANDGRKISDQVLNRMTLLTNGYAYAFQLLGYLLWDTEKKEITNNVLNSVLDEYKEELYRNVYGKIYSGLSDVDQEFVKAMAKFNEENVPIKFIEEKMAKTHNYVSIYRRRLLDDQVIISPKRGYVQFTLPFFKDFIIENGIMYE